MKRMQYEKKQLFQKFLILNYCRLYPLFSFDTISDMPSVNRNMLGSFFYAISIDCVLHVSNTGYKCIGSHSRNYKCGNSMFLNDFFSCYSWLNTLLLWYLYWACYDDGEYDYVSYDSSTGFCLEYVIQYIRIAAWATLYIIFTIPITFCFFLPDIWPYLLASGVAFCLYFHLTPYFFNTK